MSVTPVLWLLILFPDLIALYFLKLKRRVVVVSSTLLWKKSLEDFRVNAPFQKLRRNWLLILQLFVLAALVASVWKPRVTGRALGGRDLVVLVDNSASSSAREPEGMRLDLEKREALRLVDGMNEGDRMSLFTISSRTTALGNSTSDKRLLETLIRGIEPTALGTDLEQALRVATSVAESLLAPEVHVIGDGCYGDLSTLPPEVKRLNINFIGKGTPLDNMGITEVDVRKSFEVDRRTEVFALVESSSGEDAQVTVALSLDEELKDAKEIKVPAGGSAPVVFDATGLKEGIAKVSLDCADALSVDNQAWVQVLPPKTLSVLVVGRGNPWIDLALEALSSVKHRSMPSSEFMSLSSSAPPEEIQEKLAADILIFDREAPSGEPALPSLYFGCLPSLPQGIANPDLKKTPVIVDWDRTHPVNRFLVFAELYIEESFVFRAGSEYRSLVDSDAGSILGIVSYRPSGRRSVPAILVGFDILKSNWPLGHYSFPIFFSNVLSWMGTGSAENVRSRTGDVLTYDLPAGETPGSLGGVKIRLPSGREFPLTREEGGRLVFPSTDEAGVYTLLAGTEVRALFPVSLLDSRESRLIPSAKVDFGDFSVQVKSSLQEQGKDLWKWCALAALLFLVLEWFVYNRRLM